MRVFIDGDGCPVADMVIKACEKFGIEVIYVCDTAHILSRTDCKCVSVEKGKDSVDFYIINHAVKGDLVVTQDYGLGAMCLGKEIFAINQNGFTYNDSNIDDMLFRRHISREIRRHGRRSGRIKARSLKNDLSFKEGFEKLLKKALDSKEP